MDSIEVKAVFIICITPLNKIVLCHNANKPLPKLLKNIGGKVEAGEEGHPEKTRDREFLEETEQELNNYPIDSKQIKVEKKDHAILFYVARNVKLADLKKGSELDELGEFSIKEVQNMISFKEILPCHAEALTKFFLANT